LVTTLLLRRLVSQRRIGWGMYGSARH